MRTFFKIITAAFLLIFSLPLFAASSDFLADSKINNLFYSNNSRNFYFSIDYTDYNEIGYYIRKNKGDSKESEATLQRIFCPSSRKVRSISDTFIVSAEFPYLSYFFQFLYSFADYGTAPLFAAKDENGTWLFEEDALKYLCQYSKYNGWRQGYDAFYEKYSIDGRFKLEELIFDSNKDFSEPVSAFTCNGHPEALKLSKLTDVKEGFFLENTQGIWYVEKQKDKSALLYKFCSLDNQLEFSVPDR